MALLQYTTLLICFLLTVLVGLDVLIIAFAAPAISESWEIRPESLGVVFSGALSGMIGGALFLAPLADRIGRKLTILCCTVLMGASVLATAYAGSIGALIVLRVISGFGIGGLIATATTLASEYTPERSKNFWLSLVLAGYPAGAVLAGIASAALTRDGNWQAAFLFAGIVTLIFVPVTLAAVAESLAFLVSRQPSNALPQINRILKRLKAPPISALPPPTGRASAASVKRLFDGPLSTQTLLLWLAFLMAFAALYFLLSWIPKLVTEAGMPQETGIYAGTVFNAGAFAGIVSSGSLALRLGLRRTILIFFASASLLMVLFSLVPGSSWMLATFGLVGFAVQGGFVGLFVVAARLYPTPMRSTGVGWSIGIGRFGAALAPIAAGFLVAAGTTLGTAFVVFAVPCLIAGLVAQAIRLPD